MGSLERRGGPSRHKLLIALFGALIFTQFARTMAADLIPSEPTIIAGPTQPPGPTPSDSALPTPSDPPSSQPAAPIAPAPSESPPTPTPSDSASSTSSPSPSASATALPPHALADQKMAIHIPNSISVDPRARTVVLPPVRVSGSNFLLACLNSSQINFAILYPNTGAPGKGQPIVAGAGSTNLRISGTSAQVVAILNSHAGLDLQSGMRLYSTGPSVANQYVFFSLIALSEPSINSELCGAGSMSNSRTIAFHPLGLAVDMAKGNVTLKR